MKTLRDGSLLFSNGEDIPRNIPGYRQDSTNRCYWVPEPEPCIYRSQTSTLKPCGSFDVKQSCSLKDQQVSPAICNDCDDGVAPEESATDEN